MIGGLEFVDHSLKKLPGGSVVDVHTQQVLIRSDYLALVLCGRVSSQRKVHLRYVQRQSHDPPSCDVIEGVAMPTHREGFTVRTASE